LVSWRIRWLVEKWLSSYPTLFHHVLGGTFFFRELLLIEGPITGVGLPYLPVRGKPILSMPEWLSAAKRSSIILRI
jgi:hypothetical protein